MHADEVMKKKVQGLLAKGSRFSHKKKGACSVYEDITAPLEDSKELLLILKQCKNYSFLLFDSWPVL